MANPKDFVNAYQGAQQATPAIDRKSIEAALEYYSKYNCPHSKVLVATARAHLATLPKPMWTVSAKTGTSIIVRTYDNHAVALDFGRDWLSAGYYDVRVEKTYP